ncbi:hypothetical protein [Anaerorhabdus sp.]|uniref:hypothetical protein n=1 Tax=Anaerorhabdus sp. TaxID=1872524 RepID=UPI002FCC7992
MENKSRDSRFSNFIENIKVAGKVSFSEYCEYLSNKSHEDIKSIYIELLVKKNRTEKVNSLIGFTAIVSLIVSVISVWSRVIVNSKNILVENVNFAYDFIPYVSMFFILLIIILVTFIFILVNAESNCMRKILIIEEVMKEWEN